MKKIFKVLTIFLLLTLVSGICFAAPKKKDPLDAAIRETSDYLNANITKGSKIVILNIQSDSGALSEYMIDELIYNAVNDRILLVVDRQQLDAIRAEQNFQFSGEVDDKQALEIGKFFGAQTIVSGAMSMIGKEYRLRIRALEVQTALVQGQFNKNIAKSTLITTLLASKPSGTATAASVAPRPSATTPAQQAAPSSAPIVTTTQTPMQSDVNVIGTVVEGSNLAAKLRWIQTNATSNTKYTVILNNNEVISSQTFYFSGKNNITIQLVGNGGERIISLSGTGSLFNVVGITLILDKNITLRGISTNNIALVLVSNSGELVMNEGSKITGNTSNARHEPPYPGSGVLISGGGIFTMNGGEISGNTNANGNGGGVTITNGSFTMKGGIITGNFAVYGAGVDVNSDGSFIMEGGKIIGNSSSYSGGGIGINTRGTFRMTDGEIVNNNSPMGAGVFIVSGGRTILTGGIIIPAPVTR